MTTFDRERVENIEHYCCRTSSLQGLLYQQAAQINLRLGFAMYMVQLLRRTVDDNNNQTIRY
jgi:hypothetical protein